MVSRGIAIPAVPLRSLGDGHQVRFHGPCAALHFDCPTYRYSTSTIPVYYSLRPMVTGTTVHPLMICYSVFDVCCGDRPMSSPPPLSLRFLPISLRTPFARSIVRTRQVLSLVMSLGTDVLRFLNKKKLAI